MIPDNENKNKKIRMAEVRLRNTPGDLILIKNMPPQSYREADGIVLMYGVDD